MPITTAEFLDALKKYHLLEASKVDDIARQTKGKTIEPRVIAQKLIEKKLLTPYQVNQLLMGKGQQLLLGSYVLIDRLGEGGMGEVFRARHWKMNRIVALKLIRKEKLANETAVKRFQREARAAAQLDHPNVVHAFDADMVGETHLFVMEYVEGIDLAKLVKESGPLAVSQACEYIRQAALGLQHAYERKMVHRDIKPHNLLLARPNKKSAAETIKILDMGLARVTRANAEDSTSTLTQEGAVMGTPDYIAPEQAMGAHDVDIRADLYSLGCTFYFLLTGQPPFPGGTLGAKLVQHQLEEPTPVEKLRPDVPRNVAAVVRKLMTKKPEKRYQTPGELAQALAGDTWASGVASASRGLRRILLLGAAGTVLACLLLFAIGMFLTGQRTGLDANSTSKTVTKTDKRELVAYKLITWDNAIMKVMASTTQSGGESKAINVVNGNGLNRERGTHDNDKFAVTMWTSAKGDVTGWLQFDFGLPKRLAKLHIWNHNQDSRSYNGHLATNRGIREADIRVSADDITWTTIINDAPFPRADGSSDYRGFDLPLSGVNARFLRIQAKGNHGPDPDGSSHIGLAEIHFFEVVD